MDDLNQLAQVMKPEEFYVVDLYETNKVQDIKVGLCFKCIWDEEYECGIRFDGKGKIIKIGMDSVVF